MDKFLNASNKWDSGNYLESIELFQELANEGDVSAMERLATIYSDGCAVEYDFDKSIYWDKKAIQMGSIVSLSNLAITYRTRGDIRNAKLWFERAVDAGDGDAALELAKLYMVSDKEKETIVALLKQAIDSVDVCDDSKEEASRFLSEYGKS